ncbi:MAG TPA: hypothetical protein PKA90_04895 [Ignavibacteria bacterium]|nr:hypothetical protein [Ignavibacteria bacterium]HMR39746.1 hypothetical protein [Ignavibacteria bacterium]
MKIKIVKYYKTIYSDPLILNPGDEVIPGEEEKEEKWSGWILCEFNGKKGWVPKQIIKSKEDNSGIITEYYSAKELDVSEGEILNYINELNGWLLLENSKGETGWVPKENTEPA